MFWIFQLLLKIWKITWQCDTKILRNRWNIVSKEKERLCYHRKDGISTQIFFIRTQVMNSEVEKQSNMNIERLSLVFSKTVNKSDWHFDIFNLFVVYRVITKISWSLACLLLLWILVRQDHAKTLEVIITSVIPPGKITENKIKMS